jgi:hypothetical protein
VITAVKIYHTGSGVSMNKYFPNPDIEKIDIGSHMDLEKFFLN